MKFGLFPSNITKCQKFPQHVDSMKLFWTFFVLTLCSDVDWIKTFKMRRMGNYNHDRIIEDDFSLSTSSFLTKNQVEGRLFWYQDVVLKILQDFTFFACSSYIFYISILKANIAKLSRWLWVISVHLTWSRDRFHPLYFLQLSDWFRTLMCVWVI